MPDDAPVLPYARSRVANGSSLFLPGVDGRSAIARRFRDIFNAIISDLGGSTEVSEAQSQLCRRAAALSVACEQIEAELAAGNVVPLSGLITATNALRRVLDTLGLERRQRDITPTLDQYLSQRTVTDDGAEQ